jgi:hypothetical protein
MHIKILITNVLPNKEKLTSPSIPTMKPIMTMIKVIHVKKLVGLLSSRYVNITLKTIDNDLATLSVKKEKWN